MRSNREAFDELEPDPLLWDSISAAIEKPARRRVLPILVRVSSIAAIFIAGYFFSTWMHQHSIPTPAAAALPSETIQMLSDAKAFYTSQIEERSKQVFELAADQPDLRSDLQKEFNELDAMYASLEKDLGDAVATEAVVDAMIQHYRVRLQLLEEMLQQLQAQQPTAGEEVNHVY